MAKSLEEHLYRSARTKEEYLDMGSLKNRLQAIAQNLEMHRSTSSNSIGHGPADVAQQPVNFSQQSQQGAGNLVVPTPIIQNQNSGWQNQASVSSASPAMQPNMASQASFAPGQMQHAGSSNSMQNHAHHGSVNNLQHSVSHHGSVNNLQQGHHPSFVNSQNGTAVQEPASQNQNASWSSTGIGGSQSLMGQAGMMGQSNSMQQGFVDVAGHSGLIQNSMSNTAALQGMGQQGNISNMIQQNQQQAWGSSNQVSSSQSISDSSQVMGGVDFGQSRFQDPTAMQKKRVILQQQQRLLLLRHASKCTAGPNCPTKFCSQMVTLWRHMKTCRDKDCRTSHCLSSRCVLNHYRICKSNGKTATCEVCGPVMSKIKQLERDDGSVDPLAREPADPSPQLQLPVPPQQQQPQNAVDQVQLQQLQSQQLKLQARLDNLQQLQKQQNQLLEQQRRLQEQAQNIKDPNSQQAQQLHQQQMLLSQLQKRCQQQQLLLQHELQEQTGSSGNNQLQQLQGGVSGMPQQMQQQVQQLQLQQMQLQIQQQQIGMQPAPAVIPQQVPPEQPKKRRSKPETGKTIRNAKGRRGSGKGKGLSQIAAVQGETMATTKKRSSSVTSTKERAKKSKSDDEDQQIEAVPRLPVPETSLITSMTKAQISKHLESLNKKIWLSSRTVTHKCLPVIQDLIDDQFGWVFHDAVDPVALGLPDYFDVVKNPMHLELVKKKLENAIYPDMETFERDVKLVFENAILYNGENSEVGELAQTMLNKFDKLFKAVVQGERS